MNADIEDMLNFYKHGPMNGILQSYKGEFISSKEGKEYLKWCLKHGYKELYSAPDWDEYLKIKNNN